MFVQPTVITVGKDKSLKIALYARELNRVVVKYKYQMPNMECLIDLLEEQLDKPKGGLVYDPWHATRVRSNTTRPKSDWKLQIPIYWRQSQPDVSVSYGILSANHKANSFPRYSASSSRRVTE